MFGNLSSSFFSAPKIMPPHSCRAENCDGSSLHGLNITCNICLYPCFLACIKDRKEVIDILKALDFGIGGKYNQTQTQIISNKLHEIFNSESSVFSLTCPSCKPNASINDLKQKYENDTDKLKSLIESLTDQIKKLKEDKSIIEEALRIESDELSVLKTSTQSSINNNTVGGISDIITNINEFLVNHSKNQITLIENVDKMKSQFEKNNEEISKIRKFLNQVKTSDSKCPNSSISRPRLPARKQYEKDNDVFEIYLSEFHHLTTKDEIAHFILKSNPTLDTDSFIVQPLIGSKDKIERKSFISFKVTTLKKSVYDIILDNNLWSPDFSAKPFVKSPKTDINDRNPNKHSQDNFSKLRPPIINQNKFRQNNENRNAKKTTPNRPAINYNFTDRFGNHDRRYPNAYRNKRYESPGQNNFYQQPNINNPFYPYNGNFWQTHPPPHPPISTEMHHPNYNNIPSQTYHNQNTQQATYNQNSQQPNQQ